MSPVYLDYAASGLPLSEIKEEVFSDHSFLWANPSSPHQAGRLVRKQIEAVRRCFTSFFRVPSSSVIFTSGATEANNLAITGASVFKGKKCPACFSTEHASVYETVKAHGGKIMSAPFDLLRDISEKNIKTLPYMKTLSKQLKDGVTLFALLHVNNETGTINDIKAFGNYLKDVNPDIHFHVDAVQSFLKIPYDWSDGPWDSLSLSGHKFHAYKGSGVLIIKKPEKLAPLLFGGGHENGLRSGTENIAGILSMGKACDLLKGYVEERFLSMTEMKSWFCHLLKKRFTFQFFEDARQSPFILNLSSLAAPGEVFVRLLSDKGYYISTTSACASIKKKRERVLEAFGMPVNYRHGALRISFSFFTDRKELESFADAAEEAMNFLK